MFRPRTRRGQRGTAALEAVLVVPVLVTVLVLVWDFAAAAIQKGRASVAVREMAFRHLIDAADQPARDAENVVRDLTPSVKKDTKKKGWEDYKFEVRSWKIGFLASNDAGSNPIKVEDNSFALFEEGANRMLGTLAGERVFEVTLSSRRPFETILPPRAVTVRLYLDSSPWTKAELPCGYFTFLADTLGVPSEVQEWVGC